MSTTTIVKDNKIFSSNGISYSTSVDKTITLIKDFSVNLPHMNKTIIFKKGFTFNGASIPRLAWMFIGHPLSFKFIRSVLPHDGLYDIQIFSRKETDELLKFCLKNDYVEKWKIPLIYYGVRLVGWWNWNKVTFEEAEQSKKYIEIIDCV